jgi:hypothetical protein
MKRDRQNQTEGQTYQKTHKQTDTHTLTDKDKKGTNENES